MKRCSLSRRTFVGSLMSIPTALALRAVNARGMKPPEEKSPLCVFSKHLQWLDYRGAGEFAAEVGFDGLDLTVRPGGHVLPERVRDDLPRAVEEIQQAGLKVPLITTAITDADDPSTSAILETAGSLGIRFYRLGYYRYSDDEPIEATLSHAKRQLSKLAGLNRNHGVCGDYQNHAGRNYFGASIWDLWTAIDEIPPELIGSQFDLRHATVEGARSWPVDFRLVENRIHSIVAKDFKWGGANGEELEDCPLGKGLSEFPLLFKLLQRSEFSGPISVHYEYPLGGVDSGSREPDLSRQEIFGAMQRDLRVLKGWLGA